MGVRVPAAPLPTQFPANGPEKTADDGSSAHVRDPEEAPALSLDLAAVAIWGVKPADGGSLSLLLKKTGCHLACFFEYLEVI